MLKPLKNDKYLSVGVIWLLTSNSSYSGDVKRYFIQDMVQNYTKFVDYLTYQPRKRIHLSCGLLKNPE